MVSFQLVQSSILCVNTGLATEPKQERNILNDLWLQMEITVSKRGLKITVVHYCCNIFLYNVR